MLCSLYSSDHSEWQCLVWGDQSCKQQRSFHVAIETTLEVPLHKGRQPGWFTAGPHINPLRRVLKSVSVDPSSFGREAADLLHRLLASQPWAAAPPGCQAAHGESFQHFSKQSYAGACSQSLWLAFPAWGSLLEGSASMYRSPPQHNLHV